ncbi:DUF4446 family protein [Candidatus Daviesbacteria bacterium]|nr:DUF4446 family protein [Candidatus Daviesbacteria bacterium]
MYPDWGLSAVIGISYLWLLVISIVVWRERFFLRTLFPRSGERDIRKRFEELTRLVEGFEKKLEDVKVQLKVLSADGLRHIQRVELLRYNPYEDTGGDQSFSIALLDNKGDGLVLTSLHTRAGTRVFSKPVVSGKSGKYNFSREEQEVVSKAMRT